MAEIIKPTCTAIGNWGHSLKQDYGCVSTENSRMSVIFLLGEPNTAYLTPTALLETATRKAGGNGACLRP